MEKYPMIEFHARLGFIASHFFAIAIAVNATTVACAIVCLFSSYCCYLLGFAQLEAKHEINFEFTN